MKSFMMKVLSGCTAAVIAAGAFCFPASAAVREKDLQAGQTLYVVNTAGSTNMVTSPQAPKTITAVPEGAAVSVVDASISAYWDRDSNTSYEYVAVNYNGKTGYVRTKYLSRSQNPGAEGRYYGLMHVDASPEEIEALGDEASYILNLWKTDGEMYEAELSVGYDDEVVHEGVAIEQDGQIIAAFPKGYYGGENPTAENVWAVLTPDAAGTYTMQVYILSIGDSTYNDISTVSGVYRVDPDEM